MLISNQFHQDLLSVQNKNSPTSYPWKCTGYFLILAYCLAGPSPYNGSLSLCECMLSSWLFLSPLLFFSSSHVTSLSPNFW